MIENELVLKRGKKKRAGTDIEREGRRRVL
jgi:hypothetical protein